MFKYIPQVLFVLSWLFLAFLYGVVASHFNLFPAPIIREGLRYLDGSSSLGFGEAHNLYPIKYNTSGVVIHAQENVAPGTTLITSAWKDANWRNGLRLINSKGKILHQWDMNPTELFPDSPHDDLASGSKNFERNYIHGSFLLPNGDVLFNIEYLGLVRMNACGEIVWKLPYRTHHSISRNEDGNFWVSGLKWVEEGDTRAQRFPDLKVPFVDEIVVLVSPDGKILKEISLLDSLYAAGQNSLFWQGRMKTGDVTHVNDVEELTSEMAGQFGLFTAGDLVVSLKHVHAVYVMDQDGKIKWIDSGNFLYQHDPDFAADGSITVFDNRSDGTLDGSVLGGSRIVSVYPDTGVVNVVYPVRDQQSFYTSTGGKHQLLANGNRLITEAIAGRLFEVDSTGELVWEWIHENYDAQRVAEVMEGTRYAITEAQVRQWQCTNPG